MRVQPFRKLLHNQQPLYLQLAQLVRDQIHAGAYGPGDPLPSEEQMAAEFGVSLITVREARRLLVSEGLIWRQSGRGTFVAQKARPLTYRHATNMADVYAGGGEVGGVAAGDGPGARREFLARRVIRADAENADLLHIPPGTKVVELQVRTHVDQLPLGYVVSVVPFALGKALTARRLEEAPLALLLTEASGMPILEADQWTSAAAASQRTAALLGIRVGEPILVIRRVFYDRAGVPVQLSTNRFRGDRFQEHVRLHWPTQESIPLLAERREATQRYDVQTSRAPRSAPRRRPRDRRARPFATERS